MREIKFRLIRGDKVIGLELHTNVCGTISILHAESDKHICRYIYPDYKYWIPHDAKEQYTGLKDEYGQDIYEGDIVEHSCGKVFVIEWVEYGWNPCVEHCVKPRRLKKVVGNIHENPELLNKQSNDSSPGDAN